MCPSSFKVLISSLAVSGALSVYRVALLSSRSRSLDSLEGDLFVELMQGVRLRPAGEGAAAMGKRRGAALTIDGGEAPEKRIERLIRENPVIIFSRRSCCMCHVVKRLLATVGVHPTVIELEEEEGDAVVPAAGAPAVFIGGAPVGGLEGLMALHLSGRLVPRLHEVGALWA